MFIQVFRKTDGTPKLIQGMTVPETLEIEYEFDTDIYTEFTPTDGLYDPIHFDGERWVGTSKEEWEENRPESDPDVPSTNDFLNAQLLANDLEHNSKIEGLQQDVANLTAELLKSQGGTSDVHDA
ncbi:hypothetical protein [Staphylococcus equorum]|uniref:hypothetical protein n=1 Tax=Staphylococcus equorum TaxID=246432 RepID=UPI003CEC429F